MLRIDGRKNHELRNFKAKIGFFDSDGSCQLQMGNTIVLCIINGPQQGQGINVVCKEAFFGKLLQQVFQPLVFTNSLIEIHIQVLQNDGGLLCCMINSVTLALIDAGIPLRDYCCSCTGDSVKLDLNQYEEINNSFITMAVLKSSSKVVLLNLEPRMDISEFESGLKLIRNGCLEVGELMNQAILGKE